MTSNNQASDREKLRVMLPHWIEHNQAHAEEFQVWEAKAPEIGKQISAAVMHLKEANQWLQRALDQLGGPLEPNHHEHPRSNSKDSQV
jgi:hypothetical protein